jgi:hypothetical protein
VWKVEHSGPFWGWVQVMFNYEITSCHQKYCLEKIDIPFVKREGESIFRSNSFCFKSCENKNAPIPLYEEFSELFL